MRIRFEGASRQVGRSQFEVDTGEMTLLLDAGVARDEEKTPLKPTARPDAIILSHAHLDHSGFLPSYYRNQRMPWLTTFPTLPITGILWPDSIKVMRSRKESPHITEKEIKGCVRHCVALPLHEPYEFYDGTTAELHDAGHILGSAQVLLEKGNKTLIYTGDFNLGETRNHYPAELPAKGVSGLIIESTYSDRDHAPRAETERAFVTAVRQAIEGGNALVPCFALGRTQEILQVLEAAGVRAPTWVDGMGEDVNAVYQEYTSFVRDHAALERAIGRAKPVENTSQRRAIAEGKGNVIITTAGMLEGGPVLSYLDKMNNAGRGAVLLTGYQVEETNGRRLVDSKLVKYNGKILKVSLPVKQFDFSAHTGMTKSFEYIRTVNPERVFCVHGDAGVCEGFAERLRREGFDAVAPKIGEEHEI